MAQIRLYAPFSWKFRVSFERANCQLRPRVGNKIPTAIHRCEKRLSLSLSLSPAFSLHPPFFLFQLVCRITHICEAQRIVRVASSRQTCPQVYYQQVYVHEAQASARITGSRGVHLSKRFNYQGLRVSFFVPAPPPRSASRSKIVNENRIMPRHSSGEY